MNIQMLYFYLINMIIRRYVNRMEMSRYIVLLMKNVLKWLAKCEILLTPMYLEYKKNLEK